MSQLMKNKHGQQVKPYAKGGAVHDDVAEDKKMIKKMVKPAALTGMKKGGKAKGKC